MREMFKEGELICAEVHCKKIKHINLYFLALNNDKTINLHTRNIKYGKVRNFIFVSILFSLILEFLSKSIIN